MSCFRVQRQSVDQLSFIIKFEMQIITDYNKVSEMRPNHNNQQRKAAIHAVKLQVLNDYFCNQERGFDQSFIDNIFAIAAEDQETWQLLQKNALKLLTSCQQVTTIFMSRMLCYPKLRPIAVKFIKDVIQLKINVYNRHFELFIIQNLNETLCQPQFNNQQTLYAVLVYLALKIRSFDLSIRLTALKAMKGIAQRVNSDLKYGEPVLKEVVPQMIEKQVLVRQVSYTKGLFLHVLQDEFSEMRMNCIQILMFLRSYFKPQDLKLIIVYMLNDQHQIVREEALMATRSLVDQPFSKQDLQTIMMCLKQKRTNMRKLVYETLSSAQITQISHLMLIIQKVLSTLMNYKSDKKSIYKMLFSLGRKYQTNIHNLPEKLGIIDDQEPNWKSILYKAKMILCYHWWNNNFDHVKLPSYFSKSMLYIRDVQTYLFDQKADIELEHPGFDVPSMSNAQLLQLIDSEINLSSEFHLTILNVLRQILVGDLSQKLKKRLNQLQLEYELSLQEFQLIQSIEKLMNLKQHARVSEIVVVLKNCIESRQKYEQNDQQVKRNKCAISKMQPNCVYSSKNGRFQEKIYLKCFKHHLIGGNNKLEFKRLIECSKQKQDASFVYWSIKLSRYNRVQCLINVPEGEKVLDVYETEYRV